MTMADHDHDIDDQQHLDLDDPDTSVPAVTVTSIHHETLAEPGLPMSFKDRARFRLSAPVSDLGSDVWANDALLDALDRAPDADALEAIVALRKMVGGGDDDEEEAEDGHGDGDGDASAPRSTSPDAHDDHDDHSAAHAPPRPPRVNDDTLLPPPPRRSRSLPPPSMRAPHPLASPPLQAPPAPTVLTTVAKRTVSMAWTTIAKHMPPPPVPPVPPLHSIPLPRALPVISGDFNAPPAPLAVPVTVGDLNVPPEPVVAVDDFTAPPLPPALPPPAPHVLPAGRSPSLPPPPRRNSSVSPTTSVPRRQTHRPAAPSPAPAGASSESTIDAWLSDADSALVKLHAMLDAVERQVATDERTRGRTWYGDGGGRWTRTTLPRRGGGAEGEGEQGVSTA
ncbi:hypothetical protein AMAG_03932 [Allomyces macrogynus ATCC 38327]|uniref:Uncharacterized protein n=1 Tax=Allomyces macrogynus (strain ATCC 38327) TaxID=578462 RepID=A0A0L0S6W2_ALLM3|nr:hypothetical protein AMAG_03932 [Allomyces macrogynus ATCC 38327]|eukprot:KNE58348.1 hypothetical protein AMAG_03932 [Allomyces macrogynus ATCC 38327]